MSALKSNQYLSADVGTLNLRSGWRSGWLAGWLTRSLLPYCIGLIMCEATEIMSVHIQYGRADVGDSARATGEQGNRDLVNQPTGQPTNHPTNRTFNRTLDSRSHCPSLILLLFFFITVLQCARRHPFDAQNFRPELGISQKIYVQCQHWQFWWPLFVGHTGPGVRGHGNICCFSLFFLDIYSS